MRTLKQIVLTTILIVITFFAVLYTSCSKDACKGVTCLNNGTCSGGTCSCPSGAGGNNCQTIYRTLDSGVYVGVGRRDTGSLYADSATMVFSPTIDTIYTNMHLSITDSANNIVFSNFAITLINNSSTGSTFSLAPIAYDTFMISGTGTVNGTLASFNLTLKDNTDTLYRTITYNSFSKEY